MRKKYPNYRYRLGLTVTRYEHHRTQTMASQEWEHFRAYYNSPYTHCIAYMRQLSPVRRHGPNWFRFREWEE